MRLPRGRGPISAAVLGAVSRRTVLDQDALAGLISGLPDDVDVLTDDDLHLALWTLYELHYRGFDDVEEDREWDPGLIAARAVLEERLLAQVRLATEEWVRPALEGKGDVAERLFLLTETV